MGSTARYFLDVTEPYLAVAFLTAAIFSVFMLWRDWNTGMRPTTREAWIGAIMVVAGVGVHFMTVHALHSYGMPWRGTLAVTALAVRTLLLGVGLLVVVRAWSRNHYSERGWLTFLGIVLLSGAVLDWMLDMHAGRV